MKRLVKKTSLILLLLFVTISAVFFLMHSIGDGPSIINSAQVDQSVKEIFIKKYGLAKPLYIQLLYFWKNLFSGNFGVSLSIHVGKEINGFIWTKFGHSLLVGGIAAVVSVVFGILLGILIGLRIHKTFDKIMQVVISLFVAIPSFIMAVVFVIIASKSGWPITYEVDNPTTWILPIISIGIPSSMVTAKFMRTRIATARNSQYVKFAISKGLSPRRVLMRHLLKESLFTISTNLPATILLSVVSSILIENIFTIPGLGRLYTQAIQTKDYNVVLAITSILVILVAISFILRDYLYTILDPRIRRGGQNG